MEGLLEEVTFAQTLEETGKNHQAEQHAQRPWGRYEPGVSKERKE